MANPFIADPSILINFFRGVPETRYLTSAYEEGQIFIPTIVRYELLCGVKEQKHREQRKQFLAECQMLDLTPEIADLAGELYSDLRDRGRTIDNEDIIIAATAVVHDLPVATLNVRHFEGINKLRLFTNLN